MQRKIRWQERMRDILDVPLEGISNWSTVQIVGDCEISVSGCEGVLIYMPDRVLLRGVSGNVLILGEHLEMHSLSGDRITVCGRIASVHPNYQEDSLW
jgi:sporulation protein YqfC